MGEWILLYTYMMEYVFCDLGCVFIDYFGKYFISW